MLVRNFAVKFALLTARITGEERPSPQVYLDMPPYEALQHYKSHLSDEARGMLLFGFSDKALLDILDEEFEVDVDRNGLVFRKTFLDAHSIRLARGRLGSNEARHFSPTEETLIENLSVWLFDATRSLYRQELDEVRQADIKREYTENFRVYAEKNATDTEPGGAELLFRSLFGSIKAMSAFTHAMTVDAMFKADAAKAIFGEQSGYAQAWFRKQIFRHMMSKAVEQYITSCAL